MARKIAYLVSRFPKISETFILHEILDLQRRGLEIEIFPLVQQKESKVHHEAETLVRKAHYIRILSWPVLFAQIYWLSRRPSVYFRSWWKALRGNLFSWKFLLRTLFVVPFSAWLALEMRKNQIEHVHAHWATHPALAAYIVKQLTGLPYSITAHAHDIYVDRTMLEEKLRETEFIVTISEYNRKLLAQYGPEFAKKIHVVHCGINPDVFQPSQDPRCSFSAQPVIPFTILNVASLNDYKGHRYLVEACFKLKEYVKDFRCILAGDGPERKKIEEQIKSYGLRQEVQLLGWQDSEEIHRWMRQADVLVLPSVVTESGKREGIPVALMEALAMEVPVVATSISGIPELVEHGKSGLLVPERESSSLAAALLLMYQQPEMGKEMARIGRARVLSEFNLHVNSGILYRLFSGEADASILNHPYPTLDSWQKQEGVPC